MVVARRTRLHPDVRKAQLVELGLEMLAGRPLDQLPIDDIAAAAGISRGLLFHYFPTKRDFGLAVVKAAARHLLEETNPDPALDALSQLRAGIDAYVGFVERNRDLYLALVRGAAGSDIALAQVHEETRSALADRILAGMQLTSPPPPGVLLAVRGWLAFAEEATVEWVRDRKKIKRPEFVRFLEEGLVRLVDLAAQLRKAAP
jgi:AcrR family transcriptional regulator